MFGGPPMMPQFAPQVARPGQPAPSYNVPAAMASMNAPSRPAPASQAMTTTPPRAQPLVRGQSPEEPAAPHRTEAPRFVPVAEKAAPLTLPAPEQLGVSAPGTIDWSSAHARLEKLGATCFHQEKLSSGACRVTCVLPSSGGKQAHHVDAEAGSAAEAVGVALAEAERWAGHR